MLESIQDQERIIFRACSLCGSDNSNCPPGIYSQVPWIIKSCSKCGFTYMENVPTYPMLESQFAWEKTSLEENHKRLKSCPLIKRMSGVIKQFRRRILKRDKIGKWVKHYIQPGNILDVGCGTGHVLENLPENYHPYGIEISKNLAKLSRERVERRGGIIVHANAIDGITSFSQEFFSGILLSSFLEHESDPGKLLRTLYPVLRKDAGIIIKVPNYSSWNRKFRGSNWCGFRYPDHVNYFTPHTLNKLVQDCGYRIGRFNFIDHFPLSDNMWMLIQK